jgi:predicted amidophosphoribosyltransferase
MAQDPVHHCPDCGQALRFPENVGGVLMACPVCGRRFASSFKLASASRPTGTVKTPAPPLAPVAVPATPESPASPPATTTLAARVAALYASKA